MDADAGKSGEVRRMLFTLQIDWLGHLRVFLLLPMGRHMSRCPSGGSKVLIPRGTLSSALCVIDHLTGFNLGQVTREHVQ